MTIALTVSPRFRYLCMTWFYRQGDILSFWLAEFVSDFDLRILREYNSWSLFEDSWFASWETSCINVQVSKCPSVQVSKCYITNSIPCDSPPQRKTAQLRKLHLRITAICLCGFLNVAGKDPGADVVASHNQIGKIRGTGFLVWKIFPINIPIFFRQLIKPTGVV